MFFNWTICLLLLNCKSLCNFAFERILLSSRNWVWVRKVRLESLSLSGPVGSQQGNLGYFLDLFAFYVFILKLCSYGGSRGTLLFHGEDV